MRTRIVVLLALGLLPAAFAVAQTPNPAPAPAQNAAPAAPPSPKGPEAVEGVQPPAPPVEGEGPLLDGAQPGEMGKLVETLRMVRMAEELGLNDEQTVLLMRRIKSARESVEKQAEERRAKATALREAMKVGASDSDVQAKLDEIMALDRKIEEGRLKAFEEAAAQLTVSQRAKLYLFQQDFDRKLRDLVDKARERRMEWMKNQGGVSNGLQGAAPGALRQQWLRNGGVCGALGQGGQPLPPPPSPPQTGQSQTPPAAEGQPPAAQP